MRDEEWWHEPTGVVWQGPKSQEVTISDSRCRAIDLQKPGRSCGGEASPKTVEPATRCGEARGIFGVIYAAVSQLTRPHHPQPCILRWIFSSW